MNLKRIHYSGGLTQERFLENGGGRRKPTLLRVKALLGEDTSEDLPRTFGIVLEQEPSKPSPPKGYPMLVLVPKRVTE
jgi:hypothetical protein